MNGYFSCPAEALPPVRRAREFHLYDFKGRRYLDMFLSRGSAVLGHRCSGYSLVMKNALEQSMYMAYPNIWQVRLLQECSRIFTGYQVQIFSEDPFTDGVWFEPWETWEKFDMVSHAFWRPGLMAPKAQYSALVLPVSFHPAWIIVSPTSGMLGDIQNNLDRFAPVSSVFARLLLKALSNWKIADILEPMSKKWYRLFSRFCTVHGRYFFSCLPEDQHRQWCIYARDQGIFLPPRPFMAGFLPTLMSKGEQEILEKVLQWD